jgi:hypothetical protein
VVVLLLFAPLVVFRLLIPPLVVASRVSRISIESDRLPNHLLVLLHLARALNLVHLVTHAPDLHPRSRRFRRIRAHDTRSVAIVPGGLATAIVAEVRVPNGRVLRVWV